MGRPLRPPALQLAMGADSHEVTMATHPALSRDLSREDSVYLEGAHSLTGQQTLARQAACSCQTHYRVLEVA